MMIRITFAFLLLTNVSWASCPSGPSAWSLGYMRRGKAVLHRNKRIDAIGFRRLRQ